MVGRKNEREKQQLFLGSINPEGVVDSLLPSTVSELGSRRISVIPHTLPSKGSGWERGLWFSSPSRWGLVGHTYTS